MIEAKFYKKLNGNVRCLLCRHRCVISEGKRGICGVRENRGGKLYSLVYGKLIAYHVDPIEKKPLFHFLPGTYSYSIATVGCNFSCLHCQNWEISQLPKGDKHIPGKEISPEDVVEEAKLTNCRSISYTYTEPTIFYEFAFDAAKLAHKENIKNVFVTNGYINDEPLEEISKYLDAANIDLKGFNRDFYRKVCGADLDEVLDSIKLYKKLGIWIEITTLIIPKYNDNEDELREIAEFIKNELGKDVPWHVTRFHPDYKLTDVSPTPVETLRRARDIGYDVGLRYVYEGNVFEGENTYCYNCKELLIERRGFDVLKYNIKDGKCPKCGSKIAGIWK